jgi:hypothetical protein
MTKLALIGRYGLGFGLGYAYSRIRKSQELVGISLSMSISISLGHGGFVGREVIRFGKGIFNAGCVHSTVITKLIADIMSLTD